MQKFFNVRCRDENVRSWILRVPLISMAIAKVTRVSDRLEEELDKHLYDSGTQ